MGTAVATGTAVGSGMDPGPVEQRARKSGEASRQTLEENMREPMRRYLAYGYRDLSDADLKHVLSFLQSTAGKQYISAYLASLEAGFYAMGRRCGEQLGESLRELAMAQLATESAESSATCSQTPSLKGSRRPVHRSRLKRGQEIAQQDADHADLIFQSMIGIEYVQRRPMLSRPADDCCPPARYHRASHARWRSARPHLAACIFRSQACRRPAPARIALLPRGGARRRRRHGRPCWSPPAPSAL